MDQGVGRATQCGDGLQQVPQADVCLLLEHPAPRLSHTSCRGREPSRQPPPYLNSSMMVMSAPSKPAFPIKNVPDSVQIPAPTR